MGGGEKMGSFLMSETAEKKEEPRESCGSRDVGAIIYSYVSFDSFSFAVTYFKSKLPP